MRVISGTARGKRLISLEGLETRPTLDRVKEAIFNIIQFDIKKSTFLDLFAGSGAIGIEALSRGAEEVIFGEVSPKSAYIINQNLVNTRLQDKANVINKDYIEVLKELSKNNKKFDIIFLDPPYKSDFIIKSIEKIIELNLLAKDGIIISETDDKDKIGDILKNKSIIVYDTRKYGIANLVFVRKG